MLPGGGADYPGAIGFKTGFTDHAQHTLVAAATRNGRTLIAVVLGVPDAGYQEAASLLDAGFATAPDAAGTGVDPAGGRGLPVRGSRRPTRLRSPSSERRTIRRPRPR